MTHESQIGYSSYGCAALQPPEDDVAFDDEKQAILDNCEGEAQDLFGHMSESGCAAAMALTHNLDVDTFMLKRLAFIEALEPAAEKLTEARIAARSRPSAPYRPQTVNQQLAFALQWAAGVLESFGQPSAIDCISNAKRALRDASNMSGDNKQNFNGNPALTTPHLPPSCGRGASGSHLFTETCK